MTDKQKNKKKKIVHLRNEPNLSLKLGLITKQANLKHKNVFVNKFMSRGGTKGVEGGNCSPGSLKKSH